MFRVGDRVFDTQKGSGEVYRILRVIDHTVEVLFADGSVLEYTTDGFRFPRDARPMLYHEEPQIVAPPEPKRIQTVWVLGLYSKRPGYFVVNSYDTREEAEDAIPKGYQKAFLVEVEVADGGRDGNSWRV